MSVLSRGTRLGPYEVIDLVGRGGMGEVYRAHDTRLGRTVAIKTLSADIARDSEFKQRFEREARALAALSHPNTPVISPDGHAVLLSTTGVAVPVWLLDSDRGSARPVETSQDLVTSAAAWLTEDEVLLAQRGEEDRPRIFRSRLLAGTRTEVFVGEPNAGLRHLSAAKNGLVAFAYSLPEGSFDIWTLPLGNPGEAKPWLSTPAREDSPHISPDGRLITYVSNQSGRFEVYVARIDQQGNPTRVSPDGGLEPLFARSGRELFFRRGDEMWSVPISLNASTVELGTPLRLFRANYARRQEPPGRAYDVSPDGSRFVMLKDTQDQSDEIKVVFNFFELLKEKVR